MKTEQKLNLGLAILLFLCLLHWPYGFYSLVRFVTMVFFGYKLLTRYDRIKKFDNTALLYIAIALLFQPFYKVILGRTLWNFVDVLVGIYLLYETFNKKFKK